MRGNCKNITLDITTALIDQALVVASFPYLKKAVSHLLFLYVSISFYAELGGHPKANAGKQVGAFGGRFRQ